MYEENVVRFKKRAKEGGLGLPRDINTDIRTGGEGAGVGEAESAPTQDYQPSQGTLYPQLQNHSPVQPDPAPAPPEGVSQGTQGPHIGLTPSTDFNAELRDIYREVTHHGLYNFQGAQRRVPSGLCGSRTISPQDKTPPDKIPLDNIPPDDISGKTCFSKKKIIINSSVLNYPKTCVSKINNFKLKNIPVF